LAFPKWFYQDPSKHVKFPREKRGELKRRTLTKSEEARRKLEELFKERPNEQK